MPGLAPGIFILRKRFQERFNTRALQDKCASNLKIEFRQKTGAIPA
jgi:hypothetical protein